MKTTYAIGEGSPADVLLELGAVVEAEIPAELRPDDAITDPDDLVGLLVAEDLAANQVLVEGQFRQQPKTVDKAPDTIAAVREDGWLVVIDRTNGDQRELYFYADPDEIDEVGMSYFIDSVELSPNAEWVYFSTCCEPASGVTYRIRADGSQEEPEQLAFMGEPRLSPDGRFLAGSSSMYLTVTGAEPAPPGTEPVAAPSPTGAASIATLEVDCCVQDLAWSPDGSRLIVSIGSGAEGEVPQVRELTFDGRSLTLLPADKPDNPGEFPNYMPDGTSIVQVSGDEGTTMRDRYRSVTRDASYEWILYVGTDGAASYERNMRSDGGFLDGLPPLLAADW